MQGQKHCNLHLAHAVDPPPGSSLLLIVSGVAAMYLPPPRNGPVCNEPRIMPATWATAKDCKQRDLKLMRDFDNRLTISFMLVMVVVMLVSTGGSCGDDTGGCGETDAAIQAGTSHLYP